jgi:hypothetical protein
MKRFFTRILRTLHLDFFAQADREIDARYDAIAEEVAERFSRGNVCIQDRQIVTSRDLDVELAQLSSLEFCRN